MARFSLPFGKGKSGDQARPSWLPSPASSSPPEPPPAPQAAAPPEAPAGPEPAAAPEAPAAPAAPEPAAAPEASAAPQAPEAPAAQPEGSLWLPPASSAPSASSGSSDPSSWLAPSGQAPAEDEPAPIRWEPTRGQGQEQNGQAQEQNGQAHEQSPSSESEDADTKSESEDQQEASSEPQGEARSEPEDREESKDGEARSEPEGREESEDGEARSKSEDGEDKSESDADGADWKKEAEEKGDVPESGREPVEPLSMQDRDSEDDRLSRTAVPPMEGSGSDALDHSDEDKSSDDEDHDSEHQRTRGESEEEEAESEHERSRGESEDFDWEQPGEGSGEEEESAKESGSRVSVVDEKPARPDPPSGASEEEYKWHTYKVYPSGRPDAVEFIDTYKAFGKNRILRGLNMGLPEGMVSMILGPSGTGKSVCIKHMVGLLYPDEGDILVHGTSVPNMPDDDLFDMRKKFGLLFQDGALFGSMNLYDNVAFPLRQHTEKSEDEIDDIVMRRLNEVGLGSAREKYPNELSGGMRKRAGFARALVLEPDIVLFDEPDSGLDPVRTALLGELILEIHRDMMEEAKEKQKTHLPTFAVITHDIMSARRVADYINVLWKGRIVEAGPAEDMLNSDNPFIRQFLAGESQGPLTMD